MWAFSAASSTPVIRSAAVAILTMVATLPLKGLALRPPLQYQRERDEEARIDHDEDEIQAEVGAQERCTRDQQGGVVGRPAG